MYYYGLNTVREERVEEIEIITRFEISFFFKEAMMNQGGNYF
jgi:hypothetical protein